jgi:hypothetical protein
MKFHKLPKNYKPIALQDLSGDMNYCVIVGKEPSFFLLNKYKTAKTYGQQKILIPESLTTILNLYLKFHPSSADKSKEFPFLCSLNKTPITADNSITRTLNKLFDKKVGSSMLRHIYLSDKYNIEDMKKDAEAMGHSILQQKEYMKGESTSSPLEDTPPEQTPATLVSQTESNLNNSPSSVPLPVEPT